jgi:AcrR family transcriptional regulator
VLSPDDDRPASSLTARLAGRAVERSVERRRVEYEQEMARIIEATFELIRRTGTLEPSMRDILAETGLSTQTFYRYFRSKDELMLGLLDEGRRRLLSSLERRMAETPKPAKKVQAWIEGVMAQVSTASAAARTRPWVANELRLAEQFPEEQHASVELLIGLLLRPVMDLGGARTEEAAHGRATAVYRLTFATLQSHLAEGTKPSAREVDELVAFCLRGIGTTDRRRREGK